ncbi:MAG: hypothetical protein IPK08_00515 [Bacteroidetes bacterium]|nr:hypothetical protein [Bacteroidota bacterium]
MNFVLPTVLLILILLPGFVLRRAFFDSQKGSLEANYFYSSLVWALLISFCFTLPQFRFYNYFIEPYFIKDNLAIYYPDVFKILGLEADKDKYDSIDSHPIRFGCYFLIVCIFAFTIGRLLQYCVVKWKIDIKVRSLRFKNSWYYHLTGIVCQFEDNKIKPKDVVLTEIHILINVGDANVVYRGIVADYKLDGDDLDYIVLTDVTRRRLVVDFGGNEISNHQKALNNPSHVVAGDTMIFKYSNIINLSLTYLTLDQDAANRLLQTKGERNKKTSFIKRILFGRNGSINFLGLCIVK